MSYGGRRGVNVSQYIANLNTVTPPEDPLESPPNLEEDLALFTSNDFIDWDGSTGTAGFNQTQTSFNVNFEQPTNATGASVSEAPKMDFNLDSESALLSLFFYCYFVLFLRRFLPSLSRRLFIAPSAFP
jgi:hypothetical protein